MTLVLQPEPSGLWRLTFRSLPFVWLSGLVCSVALYFKAAPDFLPLMRGSSSVSIVGSIFAASLPFLISAFAVLISKPWLLLCVAFLKTFFFGLVSLSLLLDYGSGGWLIRQLLMFHEIFSIPIFYIFLRRLLIAGRLPAAAELLLGFSLEILIIGMHLQVIAPFLSGLNIL